MADNITFKGADKTVAKRKQFTLTDEHRDAYRRCEHLRAMLELEAWIIAELADLEHSADILDAWIRWGNSEVKNTKWRNRLADLCERIRVGRDLLRQLRLGE